MPTKPDLMTWVPDDDPAKIVDPGASKKLQGYIYKEKPPFQYFNYLLNQTFKWLRGLQGGYYNVVVGSSSQKAAFSATHTVDDLGDAVVTAGSRVMFLEGPHVMTADIVLTSADCVFEMENAGAIINLTSQWNLHLDGPRTMARLRFSNAPGESDAVKIGGASSVATIIDVLSANVEVSATSYVSCVGIAPDIKLNNLTLPRRNVPNSWSAQQWLPTVSLPFADPINAWNLNTAPRAELILTANTTIEAPLNMQPLGSYTLIVRQDPTTGGWGITYDTPAFDFGDRGQPDHTVRGPDEFDIVGFVAYAGKMRGGYLNGFVP